MRRGLCITATALLIGFALSTPLDSQAQAEDPVAKKCVAHEEVTLSVNFSNQLLEIKEAIKFIDNKIAEIEAIAKESGVEGLEQRGKNVNINSNNARYPHMQQGAQISPTAVNLNGSASFTLENSENTGAFIETLQTKGFNINFRMSTNSRCR